MRNRPIDRLPPLDLLASFEAAARHLSFTRAAEERFVTQSAMSRQIRALEDLLGVPREHLEFSLWYLRENALVVRGDSMRYAITAKGCDLVEQEPAAVAQGREDRLLPEPERSSAAAA